MVTQNAAQEAEPEAGAATRREEASGASATNPHHPSSQACSSTPPTVLQSLYSVTGDVRQPVACVRWLKEEPCPQSCPIL